MNVKIQKKAKTTQNNFKEQKNFKILKKITFKKVQFTRALQSTPVRIRGGWSVRDRRTTILVSNIVYLHLYMNISGLPYCHNIVYSQCGQHIIEWGGGPLSLLLYTLHTAVYTEVHTTVHTALHCTLRYTLHYTLHCTVHWGADYSTHCTALYTEVHTTVYTALHCTMRYPLQYTLHCTVHWGTH